MFLHINKVDRTPLASENTRVASQTPTRCQKTKPPKKVFVKDNTNIKRLTLNRLNIKTTYINVSRLWHILEEGLEDTSLSLIFKIVKVQRLSIIRFDLFVDKKLDASVITDCLNKKNNSISPWSIHVRKNLKEVPTHTFSHNVINHKLFNICTWNINGIKSKLEQIKIWNESKYLDIMAFQETRIHPDWNSCGNFNGYKYFGTPSNASRNYCHGTCLFIKNKLAKLTSIIKIINHEQIWLEINVSPPLLVGSVYIPNDSKAKSWELIDEICQNYKHHRIIILGDFNDDPARKVYPTFSDYLNNYSMGSFSGSNLTYFHSGSYVSSIDHILVSPDIGLCNHKSYVDRSDISDHSPVISSFENLFEFKRASQKKIVQSTAMNISKRVIVDKWSDIDNNSFKKIFNVVSNSKTKLVSKAWEDFQSGVENIFTERITSENTEDKVKKKKELKKEKNWFNDACKIAVKERTSKFKKLINCSPNISEHTRNKLLNDWTDSRKKCSKIISDARKVAWDNLINNINDQSFIGSKAFWNSMNKLGLSKFAKNNASGVPIYKYPFKEGSDLAFGDEALKVWENHFMSLMSKRREHNTEYLNQCEIEYDDVNPKTFDKIQCLSSTINSKITTDEIEVAITHMKNNKASGEDNWTYEIYKSIWNSNSGKKSITKLFNDVFKSGIIPESWKTSVIVPIPKTGDLKDPNNWRGIALIDCGCKILTKIITNRIYSELENINFFISEQIGFREKQEAIQHSVTLVEFINGRMNQDLETFVAFVDIRKAYDSVHHGALMHKLAKAGIHGRSLKFFKSLYKDSKCKILIDGNLTDSIDYQCGVRQGCVSSPMLFDIFVNDMLDEMKDYNLGVEIEFYDVMNRKLFDLVQKGKEQDWIGVQNTNPKRVTSCFTGLLFADDLCLVANNQETLQKQLNFLSSWSDKYGLTFGISKCGVLRFPGPVPQNINFKLQNQIIPNLREYRYLGTIIDDKLSFESELNQRIKALTLSLNILRSVVNIRSLNLKSIINLIKAKCLPAALWGCEVWTRTEQQLYKLQSVFNDFLKKHILRINNNRITGTIVLRELQFKNFYTYARRRQARAIFKWLHLKNQALQHSWIRSILTYLIKGRLYRWSTGLLRWFKTYIKVDLKDKTLKIEDIQESIHDRYLNKIKKHKQKSTEHYISSDYNGKYFRIKIKDFLSSKNVSGVKELIKLRCNYFYSSKNIRRSPKRSGFILNEFLEDGSFVNTCIFCYSITDTLYHYLFECSAFNDIRKNFLTKFVNSLLGNQKKFWFSPMRSNNEKIKFLLGGNIDSLSLPHKLNKMDQERYEYVLQYLLSLRKRRWEIIGDYDGSIKEYYNSRAPLETTYPNGQCLYDKTVRSCWCTEVVEEE